jgi:hypothetical protein
VAKTEAAVAVLVVATVDLAAVEDSLLFEVYGL